MNSRITGTWSTFCPLDSDLSEQPGPLRSANASGSKEQARGQCMHNLTDLFLDRSQVLVTLLASAKVDIC